MQADDKPTPAPTNETTNPQAKAPVKRKYRGLANIGNSCYMNSFLQSLFMNLQFRRIVVEGSTLLIRQKIQQDPLYSDKDRQFVDQVVMAVVKPFAELQKLFAQLMRSLRPELTAEGVKKLAPEMFRNYQQHDSIEFGRMYLDEFFRTKLPNVFEGEVTNEILCCACGKVRARKEAFLDYQVNVKEAHLQELIENTFAEETVEGLTCDHCNQKTDKSTRRHFISKFPPCLIISVNRFHYDVTLNKNMKNHAAFTIPPVVSVRGEEYQTTSIILHRGPTPNAGHYFAFSSTGSRLDCEWVCHNDAVVTEYQGFQQVTEFLNKNLQDTPYILFLERSDHVAELQQKQPLKLRQPQEDFIKKDNIAYVKELKEKKQRQKFPKITFNLNQFIKRDDEDGDGFGGGSFYNRYVA